jgi:pyridoxamine 5'-phosphate oxidase
MRTGLYEATADPNPLRLFESWLQDATDAGLPLPGSMTLATVTEAGAPTARTLILRGLDDRGFVWLTNYRSRKGSELATKPQACLLFLWSPIERQVRVDGAVEKISDAESDAFYTSRPLEVRLEAWASTQSQPVSDRAALEAAMAQAHQRYGTDPPRPPHWGGYRLAPSSYEFWQGRDDRLHDRLLYSRAGEGWAIQRLAP